MREKTRSYKRRKGGDRTLTGFTLIETILALSLGALVITSLSLMFEVSIKSWQTNSDKGELMQHARLAMRDITDDYQYAAKLITPLEFYTLYRIYYGRMGAESGLPFEYEKIEYAHDEDNDTLSKTFVDDIVVDIAGDVEKGIRVTGFDIVPLARDSFGDLVPVSGGAIDTAIAVRAYLTLSSARNSVSLNSTILLRNKYPK